MKNGDILVYEYIENYESSLYEKYKLSKERNGRFDEKTNRLHSEWQHILKFVDDEKVDATYTMSQFQEAMTKLGVKCSYENDTDLNQYWLDVNKMFYHIHEQTKFL